MAPADVRVPTEARPGILPSPARAVSRSALARARAAAAQAALGDCRLCAHDCGVNRLAGELGLCRANAAPRCFAAQVESGDELELIPTFAIAFSGCDLRCAFCLTGEASWNPRAGELFNAARLARQARRALLDGARTVMILGGEPTIHLPAALEFAAALPDTARLIWKTNAHGSRQARELLEGVFDIWLVDYKFGNDACAQRLAKIPDYNRVVRENLHWAHPHCELIVRHLIMPGHLECCWRPVAEWLASELPGVKVSLRGGYWPAWQAARHAELRTPVTAGDRQRATRIGEELGLRLVP